MRTTYIINDAEKVIVPENAKVKYIDNMVISEITEERMYGCSFVKIGVKGCKNKIFVSSTLPEEQFKKFISDNYDIDHNELYRYY